MILRSLFVTRIYEASLAETPGFAAFNAELEQACRMVAREDKAGRAWSKANGYGGYTSYASLNDLPTRASVFGELKKNRALDRHARRFAEALAFDLGRGRLKLDSLWLNILKPGAAHTGHIHPHSVLSGTVYVATPPGSGALKLEDPRLPLMMAAPPRRADAPEDSRGFVYLTPQPRRGHHVGELAASRSAGERGQDGTDFAQLQLWLAMKLSTRSAIAVITLAATAVAACGRAQTPQEPAMAQPHQPASTSPKPVSLEHIRARNPAAVIQIVSDALGADGSIDLRHSAYGDNLSPPLRWTPVEGARAYALIVEDPDAPSPKPFVHWLIWNIPAGTTTLPEGVPAGPEPVDVAGAGQGLNGAGQIGYHGPRPPPGSGVHHYHFQVFALDGPLSLAPGADITALAAAMSGHVLADGELVGTYEQPARQ